MLLYIRRTHRFRAVTPTEYAWEYNRWEYKGNADTYANVKHFSPPTFENEQSV